jgi:hypothetical protein
VIQQVVDPCLLSGDSSSSRRGGGGVREVITVHDLALTLTYPSPSGAKGTSIRGNVVLSGEHCYSIQEKRKGALPHSAELACLYTAVSWLSR